MSETMGATGARTDVVRVDARAERGRTRVDARRCRRWCRRCRAPEVGRTTTTTTTDARATGTGVDVRAERCGFDAIERSDGDGDGAEDGAEGAGGDDAGR